MHFGNSHFDGPLSPLGLPLLGRKGHLHQICPSPAPGKLSLSDLPRKMVIIHLKNQTQTHHSLPKQLLITKLKSHVSAKKEVYAGRASHHAGVERKTPCPGIFHHAGESFPVFRPQQLGYGKVGSLFQGAQLLCDLSLLLSGNFGFCIAHDAEGIRVKKTNKKHFKSSFAKSKSSW